MKTFLIISQLVYLLCIIPWLPIWGLSFMSFDNGIALGNVTFVSAIGLYPIAVIICSIFAWLLRIRKMGIAIILNLIPMLWIVSIGLLLVFF
ncbi:MAG TPA: hypothetical protein VEV44_14195 [Pseudoneobacillus sp.]|nr:hypothetical protein [Pseudoneobacillus sp.]